MTVHREIFLSALLAILLMTSGCVSTHGSRLHFTYSQVYSRIYDLETRGENTEDFYRRLNECQQFIQSEKYAEAEDSLRILVKAVNERYQKQFPWTYTYENILFQDIYVDISLGNKVGFLAYPKDPGKFPGIIFLRGAGGSAIDLKKSVSGYAQKKFICLAPEFNDDDYLKGVVDLNKWFDIFKSQPNLDSQGIGVVSYSRGGYFAYKFIEQGLPIRAWVNFFGVVYPNMVNVEAVRHNPVPVLILYGQKDKVCPVEWAYNLEKIYKAAGVPYQIKIFKEEKHGFGREAMAEAKKIMNEFLEEYLIKGG